MLSHSGAPNLREVYFSENPRNRIKRIICRSFFATSSAVRAPVRAIVSGTRNREFWTDPTMLIQNRPKEMKYDIFNGAHRLRQRRPRRAD